jgi:hypothetical protein
VSCRRASVLAWSLSATGLVLAAVGAVLGSLGGADITDDAVVFFVLISTLILATAVVGGLVASRRPENAIGWIFCGFAAFMGLSELAAGIADIAPDQATHGVGQAAAWFANWSWVALFATTIFVLLLFPDGRLPSRRWRVAAWAGGIGAVLFTVGTAIAPGALSDYEHITNPVGADPAISGAFQLVGTVLTVGALLAAPVSVVLRYGRADATARQQIKWLAVAGVLTMVVLAAGVGVAIAGFESLGNALVLAGILAIPIAIGIGILRHRLYDIDRVISRTLTYALLTVNLGAAYVGLVLAGQAVFSSFAGGGDLAIAISTLAVAALFLPLRSRVQRLVDRRFYRRRYDAQRTLEAFGARLREQVELDELSANLAHVVRETIEPAHVSVWLREPRR